MYKTLGKTLYYSGCLIRPNRCPLGRWDRPIGSPTSTDIFKRRIKNSAFCWNVVIVLVLQHQFIAKAKQRPPNSRDRRTVRTHINRRLRFYPSRKKRKKSALPLSGAAIFQEPPHHQSTRLQSTQEENPRIIHPPADPPCCISADPPADPPNCPHIICSANQSTPLQSICRQLSAYYL